MMGERDVSLSSHSGSKRCSLKGNWPIRVVGLLGSADPRSVGGHRHLVAPWCMRSAELLVFRVETFVL